MIHTFCKYSRWGLFLLSIQWLGWVGCQKEPPSPARNRPVPAPVTSAKPIVYFGVITRYNPRVMFKEYQPIMDYLSEHTSYHFELKLGKGYQDAVDYLCTNRVQIASLGGFTYLEAHDQCGAVPILQPLNQQGEPFYHSLMVVRKDSDIRTIEDVRGHSFAFASSHSTSGYLIPATELLEHGIQFEELPVVKHFPHHDQVATAVLKGEVDVGSVKDIIAYKYLDQGLRIIHTSAKIPSVPLVVRPDCDSSLVQEVQQALLTLDFSDSATVSMLSHWNVEFQHGFIPSDDTHFARLRTIYETFPR
ncbi:MAG: phosphate/phosphite/phosphonate ABC transporter substrate-binding protein [Candidatus Neomarinimicrobiota bacterium]|nr:MAG: phosphate/phosphite/phosphonate ABC transporter substrate-binding protein [Candidatus Neomarinimicrobiota bacterium]